MSRNNTRNVGTVCSAKDEQKKIKQNAFLNKNILEYFLLFEKKK